MKRYIEHWRPTGRYFMQTEAHVYALAVAASVLLSFYPFLTVMLSLCRNVLHWPAGVDAIFVALNDYLPGDLAAFIIRNPPSLKKLEYTSMFLLLFTANGVFEPLEVALNKVWGVKANRSYLKNQLVSLGLIFMCGTLALLSLILSAMNQQWVASWVGSQQMQVWLNLVIFKVLALPISILSLFLIYWLLPNRKIAAVRVLPAAAVTGLLLEALKYANLIVWPLLRPKLAREYGVFHNSATILLWSFVAAMVILAGAEWAARREADVERESEPANILS